MKNWASTQRFLIAYRRRAPEVGIGVLVLASFFASVQPRISTDGTQPDVADAILGIPKVLQASDRVWIATREVPIPTGQAEMLQLSAAVSREYRRIGRSPAIEATLFLSKVDDARLMTGHHPPICYPASGWALEGVGDPNGFEFERQDGVVVRYQIYRFTRASGPVSELVVVNGFWTDEGVPSSSIDLAISNSLRNDSGRIGLSQFQILFQRFHSAADLHDCVVELLEAFPKAVFTGNRAEAGNSPSVAWEVKDAG